MLNIGFAMNKLPTQFCFAAGITTTTTTSGFCPTDLFLWNYSRSGWVQQRPL